jgi:glutaminase
LVRGPDLKTRRDHLLGVFSTFAGRELRIDEEVCASERSTGHRNRAIAFLELSTGMIDEPVEDHLDLYFAQCSILVTARDLAMMAATLANGGVNPLTGRRAASTNSVRRVLTVMATCGMYDWSGEWMYRVGVPAKSGVAGGILAVLPGQIGVGTFSPQLDSFGNSTRGVAVCEQLAGEFGLHLLEVNWVAGSIVRRRYDAAEVPSKRLRADEERRHLAAAGRGVHVYELQGDLYFATAEQLIRQVEAASTWAKYVIFDGRRMERAVRRDQLAGGSARPADIRRDPVALLRLAGRAAHRDPRRRTRAVHRGRRRDSRGAFLAGHRRRVGALRGSAVGRRRTGSG